MLFTANEKWNYDSKFDVMYYVFGDTSNSYGDDQTDNIVAMRDIDSDEVQGYTILNFKRICSAMETEYNILKDLIDIKKALSFCK